MGSARLPAGYAPATGRQPTGEAKPDLSVLPLAR